MSEHRTDRKKLMKGVKFLAFSLPLAFSGPTLIYFGFGNRDAGYYIPLLALGFVLAIAAAFFMYRGIQTIMSGFFGD